MTAVDLTTIRRSIFQALRENGVDLNLVKTATVVVGSGEHVPELTVEMFGKNGLSGSTI